MAITLVVVGTPGAGKTTVLSKLKLAKDIEVIGMGTEMLKFAKGILNRDKLRYLSIEEQKNLRKKVINSISRKRGIVILDTHLSIKNGNQYLPGFSISELKTLNVKGILYIDASPSEILKRRANDKTREREQDSQEEIIEQKDVNLGIISASAIALNIPFYIFQNSKGKSSEVADEIAKVIANTQDSD
ncbi:MAG: AAA family ATPase [Candidatus Micrarchaeia archaeon]